MRISDIISLGSLILAFIVFIASQKRNNKTDIKENASVIAIMENNLNHLIDDVKEIKEGVQLINAALNTTGKEITSLKEQVKTLFNKVKTLEDTVKELQEGRNR